MYRKQTLLKTVKFGFIPDALYSQLFAKFPSEVGLGHGHGAQASTSPLFAFPMKPFLHMPQLGPF